MLTQSQIEVYEDLKKYRNFPKKDLDKFPHLAHLINPAERYKFFSEAFAKDKKIKYKPVKGEDIFEDELIDFDAVPMLCRC
jgi:hypothetical protein